MIRIRKGDKVKILTGKDKGKVGQVLQVLVDKKAAIVEGANLVKKHIRRRSEAEPGGVREIPNPIRLSNLGIFCSHCNRGVRVRVKVMKDKTKAKVCTKCKKAI